MKLTLRREGEQRGWPQYLLWGRMRTSTVGLIVAFFATWWLYQTYQPPPAPTEQPAQIVPPGFVPDPEYTWVPRTYVQETSRTTSTTPTTTTTTTTSPTETTEAGTSPTDTSDAIGTTVVDPDGPGPLPPTTLTESPAPSTIPNRSGTPTTVPTTTAPSVPSTSVTPLIPLP